MTTHDVDPVYAREPQAAEGLAAAFCSALVGLLTAWEAERDNLAKDFGDDDASVDTLRRCARELRNVINRPNGLGAPGAQLQDPCREPVILDSFGCHKQVAQWIEASKYRTLIHRHDGTFVAADESEQKQVRADTIPLLADALMNWPEHGEPLPPTTWVKVPAVQNAKLSREAGQ